MWCRVVLVWARSGRHPIMMGQTERELRQAEAWIYLPTGPQPQSVLNITPQYPTAGLFCRSLKLYHRPGELVMDHR
jgi:hypothetical protein